MNIKKMNFQESNIIVVKIGTNAIVDDKGEVRKKVLRSLVEDLKNFQESGKKVVLVSSGAIQVALPFFPKTEIDIGVLQAQSALGQPKLFRFYENEMKRHQMTPAQILLTHYDLQSKVSLLNLRKTFHTLLRNNFLPIVNENDSISVDEINFGDNDQLAVRVASLLEAQSLFFLTTPDGLLDRDSCVIHYVNASKMKVFSYLKKEKTVVGRGGMESKLLAIKKANLLGIPVYIGSYKFKNPLKRLIEDEEAGTFFEPDGPHFVHSKNSRIISTLRDHCRINIDDGAMGALENGKSLLSVGIKNLKGVFRKGDSVTITSGRKTIAYGLSEWDSKDIDKFVKHKKNELVIHRDNLLLKSKVEL